MYTFLGDTLYISWKVAYLAQKWDLWDSDIKLEYWWGRQKNGWDYLRRECGVRKHKRKIRGKSEKQLPRGQGFTED